MSENRNFKVKLNGYELFSAAMVGVKRQIESLSKKLPDKHGFDGENGWTVHIEGAAGEQAVAKALNLYYGGPVNTFKKGGDVGNLQVRTRSKDYYELIIRNNDNDSDIFVLVVGRAPHFKVVGWIRALDAKKQEYSKTHGNRPAAFFVPQDRLNPFPISYERLAQNV